MHKSIPPESTAQQRVEVPQSDPTNAASVETLFRSGKIRQLTRTAASFSDAHPDIESRLRITLATGMALFELGDVVAAIETLRVTLKEATANCPKLEFPAVLALFSRESQFQSPIEALPVLSRLRQLASSIGEPSSLGGLHFVVARLEAQRGHGMNARRHLEIGRHILQGTDHSSLRSSIELVDSGLETFSGNLVRAARSARAGFDLAESASLTVTMAGCLTNFSSMMLFAGNPVRAREVRGTSNALR